MKKIVILSAGLAIAAALSLSACSTGTDVAPAPAPTGSQAVSSGGVLSAGANATGNLAAKADVANFSNTIFNQYTGPTDEMVNDGKRDLTLNNPNRVGYVYVFSAMGQLMNTYTILGKVSSTTSQLTESQDIVDDKNCVTGVSYGSGSYTQGACSNVVDSLGDDGTYGGEEGGPAGVFFFTTSGALIELGGGVTWQYSDAPLHVVSKPVLFDDMSAHPTSGIATVPGK